MPNLSLVAPPDSDHLPAARLEACRAALAMCLVCADPKSDPAALEAAAERAHSESGMFLALLARSR